MKRTTLKRKSGLRRSAKPMTRTRVKPVNRERKAELHARNFGEEAEAVWMLPCLCWARTCTWNRDRCRGDVVAAHVTARGMGGDKGGRFDLVPLCDAHHREAGEARTSERAAFEARYGLDLRKLADDAAASHAPPLGIRGLAQRILAVGCGEHEEHRIGLGDDGTARAMFFGHVWGVGNRYFACSNAEPLDTYETDALLGWVRRECEREAERRRARRCEVLGLGPDLDAPVEYDSDREALAAHVAAALGFDASLAEQLLGAAEVGHE